MTRSRGTVFLVVVLLTIVLFRLGRVVFPFVEDPPAFVVHRPGYITVYLGEGFPEIGYHQFIDGVTVSAVTQMAFTENAGKLPVFKEPDSVLRTGEGLKILSKDMKVPEVERFFVPAGQRMSLGIALHPDTMQVRDWQALPGIGPRLAARIVQNRQKMANLAKLRLFSGFPALERSLSGVWKSFFKKNKYLVSC